MFPSKDAQRECWSTPRASPKPLSLEMYLKCPAVSAHARAAYKLQGAGESPRPEPFAIGVGNQRVRFRWPWRNLLRLCSLRFLRCSVGRNHDRLAEDGLMTSQTSAMRDSGTPMSRLSTVPCL